MNEVFTAIFLVVGGLAGLTIGGEFLVRGASCLAAAARLSPLVIGLTVVAFGTSAPELAVALQAAWAGKNDVMLGNVIGSNVFNILFVLGASALVAPLAVSSKLIRLDVPLMMGASVVVLLMSLNETIGRWEGTLLFVSLVVYIVWCIRQSRRESMAVQQEFEQEFSISGQMTPRAIVAYVLLVTVGVILLAAGAAWLVDGAVRVAVMVGMDELLIGMTIVAIGTSLPEVAASLVAALRGERDIAVGNVIGSNLFNLLGVLGLTAVVSPRAIPVTGIALSIDLPVMVAVAFLPVLFIGTRIARWEGALFLAYYWVYLSYRILLARDSAFATTFGTMALAIVIPLTCVTILIGGLRWYRAVR